MVPFGLNPRGFDSVLSKFGLIATQIGSVSEGDEKMAEEGLRITFFVLLSVCTVHNITLFDHYFFLYTMLQCCSERP